MHQTSEGFPGGSDGKESACNARDLGSVPGLGRSPGAGHGNPLQYSGLENPHAQRSLVGCSPWSHKDSDTTVRLSVAQHKHRNLEIHEVENDAETATTIVRDFNILLLAID